jgi:hypothetical protein
MCYNGEKHVLRTYVYRPGQKIRDDIWKRSKMDNAPQVDIQVGNIAEIQDKVPNSMSIVDNEDIFRLTSRPNRCIESSASYPEY